MRHRFLLFLVFGAILVALAEWDAQSQRFGFVSGLNKTWREFCVANSPDKIGESAVTLVRIDDEYQPAISDQLTKADYAAIMGFIEGFDPKTVAFAPSPEFDPSEPINQTTLELLKEAALTLPPMTLGAVAENGQPPQSDAEAVKLPVIEQVEGDIAAVTPVTRLVSIPDPQLLANGDPAFTAIELAGDSEDDGSGRRLNLIGRHGDKIVPSLIVDALARYVGVGLSGVKVELPGGGKKQGLITIGEAYQIPIDGRGRMRLYEHSGVDPDAYATVSAFHLALTGDEDETVQKLLAEVSDDFETLKENLVVIGHDRSADRREVVRTAPRAFSRDEMIVRAIATIQSSRYLTWWPQWGRLLGVLVIAGIAAIAFQRSRPKAIVFALFGLFFYFGACLVIFKSNQSWAPPFAPLALFILMIVIAAVTPDPAKKDEETSEMASQ